MSTSSRRRALLLPALLIALTGASDASAAEETRSGDQLLEILRIWSSAPQGDETAVPRLVSYISQRSRDRGPTPRTREARQMRELAHGKPSVYVALIGLHSRAHRLAVVEERISAARYLHLETVRLIDEYMASVHSDEGWELGSRFLVRLAAGLRDSSGLDAARVLLSEALDLYPENAVALYALAAIQEKYGNYASAIDLLDRLLELRDLPGAELRVALCRARMGRDRDAEPELARLARSDAPEWIRAIAYQEWSQLRLRAGDPDQALALAREGHQALTSDDSLAILTAFMAGPRDETSKTIVVRLTSAPTGAGATARGVYNLWPPGITQNEARLEREVEASIPLLARALEASSGGP